VQSDATANRHVLNIFSLPCIQIKPVLIFSGSSACISLHGVSGESRDHWTCAVIGQRSLYGHVRPVEGAAAEQHVSDESINWSLADESYEEQLFDNLSGDSTE